MVVPNHLISIENFDKTNNIELVKIAHHNAHILNQMKNPVRQYNNQNSERLTSSLNPTNLLSFRNNLITNASQYGNKPVKFVVKEEQTNQQNFNVMHNTTPKILPIVKNSARTSKPGFRR
jgi:hypothetical protein